MPEFDKNLKELCISFKNDDKPVAINSSPKFTIVDSAISATDQLKDTIEVVTGRIDKIEEELNMKDANKPEVFKEGSQLTLTKIAKPMPKYIKTDGLCTIIKWTDDSVTKVKCSKNDGRQESSVYMAFCAALAKKIYGTNSKLHRMINEHTTEYLEAEQKRIKEEHKKAAMDAEKKAHYRKVKRLAKQMKLEEEAKNMFLLEKMNKGA